MNELALANRAGDWQRLKALVLDSVSSPITRRVYNLGLDEFISWYGQAPRPGFTKATVSAWRAELETRGLGSVSINVRITAVRKLAVEAADNGLLALELAAGITRVKGAKSTGVRVGNWLSVQQAQKLLNAPDVMTTAEARAGTRCQSRDRCALQDGNTQGQGSAGSPPGRVPQRAQPPGRDSRLVGSGGPEGPEILAVRRSRSVGLTRMNRDWRRLRCASRRTVQVPPLFRRLVARWRTPRSARHRACRNPSGTIPAICVRRRPSSR